MVAVSDTPSSIDSVEVLGVIVGAMQHEAAPGLDGAADMHLHGDRVTWMSSPLSDAMLSCFSSSRKLMCGAR